MCPIQIQIKSSPLGAYVQSPTSCKCVESVYLAALDTNLIGLQAACLCQADSDKLSGRLGRVIYWSVASWTAAQMSCSAANFVRLASNGTHLGRFKISFSTFWARGDEMPVTTVSVLPDVSTPCRAPIRAKLY